MSFFRYPGGKAKLKTPIVNKIIELTEGKEIHGYVEPFFGGGSICMAVLEKEIFPSLKRVWINDKDPALMALWRTVFRDPEDLIWRIEHFEPTVDKFYDFQHLLLNPADEPDLNDAYLGFLRLAVHQMSYSGLGVKAGGPIGGVKQQSNYGVDCRWSPKSMRKKILKYNQLLRRYDVSFSVGEFGHPISYAEPPAFIYLDPPYYMKGDQLYQYGSIDHYLLSQYLQAVDNWLLSYDDCEEIRDLYSWANIEELNVNYTIRTARKRSELLIYPKD